MDEYKVTPEDYIRSDGGYNPSEIGKKKDMTEKR